MTASPAHRRSTSRAIDPPMMRRLLMHEAKVHAMPGRDLRDLGDSILLHDPTDVEPFWNRLAAVHWPEAPDAFDRRLTEMLILFATLTRQPHIWPAPLYDQPSDLIARLLVNGFRDMGAGLVMTLDAHSAMAVAPELAPGTGVTMERATGLSDLAAQEVALEVVAVLTDAFEVGSERGPGIEAETAASLRNLWFTHYLVRVDGRPAAVARRATFDGLSYLSSIGTAGWARGRGFGRMVTGAAVRDALAAGSELVHLGVFADNQVAFRLYEGIGFERVGEACPDLLLV